MEANRIGFRHVADLHAVLVHGDLPGTSPLSANAQKLHGVASSGLGVATNYYNDAPANWACRFACHDKHMEPTGFWFCTGTNSGPAFFIKRLAAAS